MVEKSTCCAKRVTPEEIRIDWRGSFFSTHAGLRQLLVSLVAELAFVNVPRTFLSVQQLLLSRAIIARAYIGR
jgi:hypothetical protein